MGALSFVIATASGVIFVKIFNLILPKGDKINPLIGNAGVSAVPRLARMSQVVGLEYDPSNYLLMHAMGPNVAGVIGSAVAAGILAGIPDLKICFYKIEGGMHRVMYPSFFMLNEIRVKNASAFAFKRKYVFYLKRKCV